MGRKYRPLNERAKARYGEDVVELDLSPADERDAVDSGVLSIVPRKYRVVSNNFSAGKPGDEFETALLAEVESMLVNGGHIEVVEDKPPAKKTTTKKKSD